jgi:hypothetical protein
MKPGPAKGTPKVPNSGGSRKGRPNKATKALKDMILGALDRAGGEAYLVEQAKKNPNAFLALIGKVLPQDINARVTQCPITPEQADRIEGDD